MTENLLVYSKAICWRTVTEDQVMEGRPALFRQNGWFTALQSEGQLYRERERLPERRRDHQKKRRESYMKEGKQYIREGLRQREVDYLGEGRTALGRRGLPQGGRLPLEDKKKPTKGLPCESLPEEANCQEKNLMLNFMKS